MAIKIDMSMVYDRLEWNVLQTVLLQHGFASLFSNLANESPLKTITSHTRIRQ